MHMLMPILTLALSQTPCLSIRAIVERIESGTQKVRRSPTKSIFLYLVKDFDVHNKGWGDHILVVLRDPLMKLKDSLYFVNESWSVFIHDTDTVISDLLVEWWLGGQDLSLPVQSPCLMVTHCALGHYYIVLPQLKPMFLNKN